MQLLFLKFLSQSLLLPGCRKLRLYQFKINSIDQGSPTFQRSMCAHTHLHQSDFCSMVLCRRGTSVRLSDHCQASSKCLFSVWLQVRWNQQPSSFYLKSLSVPIVMLFHSLRNHKDTCNWLRVFTFQYLAGREGQLQKRAQTRFHTKMLGFFLSHILWASSGKDWEVHMTRLRACQGPSVMLLCRCCNCSCFWSRAQQGPRLLFPSDPQSQRLSL